jgi:O-antigen/teichoic acid export membrane protein
MAFSTETATPGATGVRGTRLALRLVGNYVFQTMNWGIRLFEQLLLIPLYLFAWGTELYKDWLILFAVIVFLNWCSFGVDDYFGNVFLRSAATGDHRALQRQVKIGLFISSAITCLILSLLSIVLLTVPIDRALGLTAMDEHTAVVCLLVAAAPLSVLYICETLRGLYRAFGDFSRGECIFAITNAVQILSIAAVLALRLPPLAVALCYGIIPFLYCFVTAVDILRRYPQVRLGLAIPTRAERRETARQSLLYFTTPLSMVLTQNVTLVAFGFIGVSAAAMVQYNVLRIFTGLTRQIGCQSFVVGSGIEMARQQAQADHAACRKLYAESGRIVACLVGVLAGVSIPVSGPFIALWTRHAVGADEAMILWFLAGVFVSAPGRVSLMLLRYTNRPLPIAIANTLQSAGGLLVAVLLVPFWGVTAAAAAFAVTEALAVGVFPAVRVQSILGFGAARHILASLAAGALAFAVSWGAATALFAAAGTGIATLVGKLLLWGLAVSPACFFLLLSRDQRAQLFSSMRRRLAFAMPIR